MNAPRFGIDAALGDQVLQQAQAPGAGSRTVAGQRTRSADRPRTAADWSKSWPRRFRLAVMDTPEMLACTPAFELLPLAKAQTRACVLLRFAGKRNGPAGEIIGVIADPFDTDCMVWLGSLADSAGALPPGAGGGHPGLPVETRRVDARGALAGA
jgi:hypothetical protein